MATIPMSSVSYVVGTVSSWFESRHQNSLARPTSRLGNIASLPKELIIAIMESAEWSDILRLRRCCKIMESTSRTRSVWVALLHRYYLMVFPRPFLLPKPLEHCTSGELEALITGWFKEVRDLSDTFSPPHISVLQVNTDDLEKLGTIPGGRFLLFSARNGSVFYLNPQSNSSPTLLIPSPFPDAEVEVTLNMSFEPLLPRDDTSLSHEALEEQWFPQSLKLVLAWNDYGTVYPLVHETVIEVWTIHPQVYNGNFLGYAGERLSSFNEEPDGGIQSCAILGDKVAYGMCGTRLPTIPAIIVVNWAGKTQGSFPCDRVYLSIYPSKNLMLLPEDRLMIVYRTQVSIWNLRQATHRHCRQPSQRKRVPLTVPAWEQSLGDTIIFETCTPFFIRNSIRIVIPTLTGLYGIVLPCFKEPPWDPSIEVLRLVEGKYNLAGADSYQSYGYRKGASNFSSSQLLLQYSWPDDLPILGIVQPITECRSWLHKHFYFDEALNCIQSFQERTSQYHVISLSNNH
ncbi:hypothetical protein FA15DRAFT_665476 [Coprinopsis marcescibilis]|uniref:F-box domain-containing protein n=1 Tax=Coprinopsis marcescibilis TaxID=230819 RepID=A0A5C3L6F7_COPMA|nr:hypothetical protein FA15DRAFT_665476 [Coprinopsis marcescibilis]